MQNGIPVGLRSSPSFGLSRSGQLTAIIQSLFWDGSQGWWYDDNDTTTLFQDSAGTTPVTAVEQFVGLQLDKSKGLVLGPELVTNGDFSNGTTGFTKGDSNSTFSVVNGQLVCNSGPTTNVFFRQTINTIAGQAYFISADIIALSNNAAIRFNVDTLGIGESFSSTLGTRRTWFIATGATTSIQIAGDAANRTGTFDNISVRQLPGNHRYAPASGNRPIWSKRVNLYVGTTALATQNVTTQATSYVLKFSGTDSITLSGTATGSFNAGVHTVTCTAGTLTSTVSGTVTDADIRPANQATGLLPLYQRVNTSTDYETTGFPGYLKADGSSDFMQTNSVSFTATDKVTSCIGMRKLSDAAIAVLAELSASIVTNNGAFAFAAPSDPSLRDYAFAAKGTVIGSVSASPNVYPAPISNILTGTANISGDLTVFRVNGSVIDANEADLGTGNFGNYPAYFFARAGTSFFFNGEEYSNITVGKLLTADQLAALELYTENQMKLALLPTDYQNLQTSAGDNLTDSSGLNLLYAQPIY